MDRNPLFGIDSSPDKNWTGFKINLFSDYKVKIPDFASTLTIADDSWEPRWPEFCVAIREEYDDN